MTALAIGFQVTPELAQQITTIASGAPVETPLLYDWQGVFYETPDDVHAFAADEPEWDAWQAALDLSEGSVSKEQYHALDDAAMALQSQVGNTSFLCGMIAGAATVGGLVGVRALLALLTEQAVQS